MCVVLCDLNTQEGSRRKLFVARRALLTYRGGAVHWSPAFAAEAALLNVEMFMRASELELPGLGACAAPAGRVSTVHLLNARRGVSLR